ncbi:Hypothetical protein DSVG11_2410 [Desulfovibrio sp. G11]|nr:Hypothetical protein DSVG11_2410 [Desulfovibrio sp. G11]
MLRRLAFILGSSPRPWGTQTRSQDTSPPMRFIPTPVGNTPDPPADPGPDPVHPHARGEHERLCFPYCYCPGSSPRPWGTLLGIRPQTFRKRFIPTPVGNTRDHKADRQARPVHPHARGEHWSECFRISNNHGSSPRPWGTHADEYLPPNGSRFIPTPVGNTCARGSARRSSTVHPHARGEHAVNRLSSSPKFGSSPRPWGTLPKAVAQAQAERFIPTPVGNTLVWRRR